jgi:hypothetical protein
MIRVKKLVIYNLLSDLTYLTRLYGPDQIELGLGKGRGKKKLD